MWLMIDASGVVVGGKGCRSENPASEFRSAVSQVEDVSGVVPLRSLEDETRSALWRWNGAAFERRPVKDVNKERRRRKLLPALIEARQKLKAAQELQSADPSSITTAQVDELRARYEDAKALR